uniref:NAD-specific glutamate dehydrogenase n=1 Tax=Brugia timori TaxID=42155 RepID=A0A0R3QC93_9BILA
LWRNTRTRTRRRLHQRSRAITKLSQKPQRPICQLHEALSHNHGIGANKRTGLAFERSTTGCVQQIVPRASAGTARITGGNRRGNREHAALERNVDEDSFARLRQVHPPAVLGRPVDRVAGDRGFVVRYSEGLLHQRRAGAHIAQARARERILDGVDALSRRVGDVARAHVASSSDDDDRLAVHLRQARARGDRLRCRAIDQELGQQHRGVVGLCRAIDVEAPEVAEFVPAIEAPRGVVRLLVDPSVDLRQPAWRGGAAHACADVGASSHAGVGVEHEKPAHAIARADVVVARCERHDPCAIRALGDDGVAESQSQVVVGELPQRPRILRICDVERVVATSALAHAAHENRLPGTAHIDVAHHRGAVDHVVVLVRVVRICKAVKIGHHGRGHVGPQLGPAIRRIGGDRMQHAIVGSHIDHGLAIPVVAHEVGVARVRVAEIRLANVPWGAVDDVAEHAGANAVQRRSAADHGVRSFVAAVAAEKVDEVRRVVGQGLVGIAQGLALSHPCVSCVSAQVEVVA